MLSVLCTGTLVSDPKARTSSSGKPFATALLRVPAEDADAMLVSAIAFDADAVAAILALSKGDACAIAGRGKLSTWEKAGEEKHGLSVVADRVLTVYQAGKLRAKARGAAQEESAGATP
jgi:single-stranded DNA-binding protein